MEEFLFRIVGSFIGAALGCILGYYIVKRISKGNKVKGGTNEQINNI